MDPELILVCGLIVAGLAVPSVIGAFSESRAPRVAMFMVVLGGAMIAWGVRSMPGGFEIHEIPDVFIRIIGRYIG